MNRNKTDERLGQEKLNKQGCKMKIICYNNAKNIIVEFQDKYKGVVHTNYKCFFDGTVKNPNFYKYRLEEKNFNYQGCLMRIVEYNNAHDIIVEFQDEHNTKVKTRYSLFLSGSVKNPYFPSVYGVGIVGKKYPTIINGKDIKEYKSWHSMLQRCFDEKLKNKHPTYKDVSCCEEWLNYENFYEWLHEQENFVKWLNNEDRWSLDKDILIKGNKIYSPNTCCLVPIGVNNLFIKNNVNRGSLPIGVVKHGRGYRVMCCNPFTSELENLGVYLTIEEAFQVYKEHKENLIKQIAEIEYNKCNITKKCYDAMMNYKVEITD